MFTSHIDKNISLTFFLTSVSLYIFTIWKCIAYNRFCRDGIYFDKILVSEYKLFKVTQFNAAIFVMDVRMVRMNCIFMSVLKSYHRLGFPLFLIPNQKTDILSFLKSNSFHFYSPFLYLMKCVLLLAHKLSILRKKEGTSNGLMQYDA